MAIRHGSGWGGDERLSYATMKLHRTAKSAAEIAALPELGTTQCLAHVRLNGSGYTAETLVHLLRASLGLHDTAFFELCGRFLIGTRGPDARWHGGHCEGVIFNLGRSFGFLANSELMREFRTNCHGEMWKAIHNHNGHSFWEMRFGLAFRQKCIEVARSLVRRSTPTDQRRYVTGDAGQEEIDRFADPNQAMIDEEVAARLSNPIHREVILGAVRRLPKRQAAAVLLAWIEGRQIEGPGDDTVSSLMGITPRGARQLLAKARMTLRANPAISAIWNGEA